MISPSLKRSSRFLSCSLQATSLAAACIFFTLAASALPAHAEQTNVAAVLQKPLQSNSVPQAHEALSARDALERVLIGEFALQQNDPMRAYKEFMRAAQKSRQAGIAERAFEAAEMAQNEEAVNAAFKLWTELDPNNSRVRLMRTGEFFSKGEFSKAAALASDLLKEADDPASLLEAIVQLSAGTEERTRLYETLESIFSKDNEDARVELVLASLAASAKMREAAKEHGLRAIELAPDNPHVLLQGADYEYALDPKSASKRLEKYLQEHPGSTQVRLSYAKSLLKTGERKKLAAQLSRIESERQDEPRTIFVLGMFAEEAQMYEKAELYYKKYLVLLAKNPGSNLLADSAYVRLGMVKLAQGHKELAVDWLDKVEQGDKYQAARIKEVEILADLRRVDDACRVLTSIRARDAGQKSSFLRSCAGLLLNSGRKSETVDVLLKAIEAAPKDAELIYQTAMAAHEAGRSADAESLLKRFIKLAPDNPNGYNSLGYMWLERNERLKDAEQLIEKAMELTDGKDPYVTDSLGWLRYRQGKLDEAEKLLVKAQNLEPADTEIALHLAEVLYVQGKAKEARAVISSILEGEPKNAKALQLRQKYERARSAPPAKPHGK